MEATVLFRDFEERDIDFIYKCKNDAKLNSLTVGEWHPFSYTEAVEWVRGCMGEHDTYKFWAICTNDREKRIVGWCGLYKIDLIHKTACMRSMVIADPQYRVGFPWIEAQIFCFSYAFDVLGIDILGDYHFADHPDSSAFGPVWFFQVDKIEKNAVVKNGISHDIVYSSLKRKVYEEHKMKGDYELMSLISRYAKFRRKIEHA